MTRTACIALVSACALVALPAASVADGLPVLGVDGGAGVLSGDGASRYISVPVGKSTLLERMSVPGGQIARFAMFRGAWSVPMVAYDGSGSGLSADGRTLVLIKNRTRFPQPRTHLAVVDPRRLRVTRHMTLRGDFSFDAISPDGSRLYLINYLARHDPTKYAVRSYDMAAGRLDPAPIVDPRNPGEEMRGFPVTRTAGPDGRWAYTLYSGGEHPFVHALDTSGRTARCVDLDSLTQRRDLFSLKLKLNSAGNRLDIVTRSGAPLAAVDTRTFAVTGPRRARAAAPASPRDSGRPWLLPALIAALLLGATGIGASRRQRVLTRGAGAR